MAAEGIGLADDGTFSDAFDFVDAVFDFAGIDVFAVHDDEVFQAVDDVDVAVFVHVGEVAGVEPAVFGEDFPGFFGLVPVAFHDVVAADEELTDGAGDVGAVHFDGDHGFDAGDGGAAGQVLGFGGRQDADDGGGFGEAVAFLHGVFVAHEEGLRDGLRDGGAAGDEGMDGLHEGGVAFAREEVVHRGDHDGDGDVVFHDGIDDFRWRARAQDDDGRVGVEAAVDDGGHAVAVEHRQDAEDFIFRFEDDACGELFYVSDEVFVCQHGAFGAAGGAGGVDQGAYVVFGEGFREIRGFGERFVRFLIQLFDGNRRDGDVHGGVCDEEGASGVFQDVVDFAVYEGVVHGDDDRAEAYDGHEGVDEFCTVRGVEADALAFADAKCVNGIPIAVDGVFECAVGDVDFAGEGEMGWIGAFHDFM